MQPRLSANVNLLETDDRKYEYGHESYVLRMAYLIFW